jgi:two-component system, OmpR family, response regulator
MNLKPRIFIVDDDLEIRHLLRTYLQREGFQTETADGGVALDRLIVAKGAPDLVVLDVMMPGEDGLSVCRRLRANAHTGILMLTARNEDIDRIVGLEIGADDYLAKPFNPRELVARIRAILRRKEAPPVQDNALVVGDLTVNVGARQATAGKNILDLTSAEFELLCCFMQRPGRVLSREQLLDWTRGRNFEPSDRTIDVSVSRLRKKLADAGARETFKTIRNAGYLLAPPAPGASR